FYDAGFGRITETDAETHDGIIAYTSQLCHIVSSAFVKNGTAMRSAGFSAGSLKDLTRVARLSPDAWTELILSNRINVLSELDEFIGNLKKYRNAVSNGDKDGLSGLFAEGNLLKEKLDGENKYAFFNGQRVFKVRYNGNGYYPRFQRKMRSVYARQKRRRCYRFQRKRPLRGRAFGIFKR
ncbi:MAG: prephenate dehydrogenase/arogenate dehydrogenase family protein, partial [Clostridia bacterium]|nr:prephenate dehydrogenase/arogenate dehydrogenase family protein [Clostridia bacterium]